jgi:hypothetical protein
VLAFLVASALYIFRIITFCHRCFQVSLSWFCFFYWQQQQKTCIEISSTILVGLSSLKTTTFRVYCTLFHRSGVLLSGRGMGFRKMGMESAWGRKEQCSASDEGSDSHLGLGVHRLESTDGRQVSTISVVTLLCQKANQTTLSRNQARGFSFQLLLLSGWIPITFFVLWLL